MKIVTHGNSGAEQGVTEAAQITGLEVEVMTRIQADSLSGKELTGRYTVVNTRYWPECYRRAVKESDLSIWIGTTNSSRYRKLQRIVDAEGKCLVVIERGTNEINLPALEHFKCIRSVYVTGLFHDQDADAYTLGKRVLSIPITYKS